jgi:hypothetical protein
MRKRSNKKFEYLVSVWVESDEGSRVRGFYPRGKGQSHGLSHGVRRRRSKRRDIKCFGRNEEPEQLTSVEYQNKKVGLKNKTSQKREVSTKEEIFKPSVGFIYFPR